MFEDLRETALPCLSKTLLSPTETFFPGSFSALLASGSSNRREEGILSPAPPRFFRWWPADEAALRTMFAEVSFTEVFLWFFFFGCGLHDLFLGFPRDKETFYLLFFLNSRCFFFFYFPT